MADYEPRGRGDYAPLNLHAPNAKANDTLLKDNQPVPVKQVYRHRLGWTHLLTLFLGLVFLVLAVTIMGLLWKESMIATTGASPRTPWIQILSRNWAPSVVTISTAVIRTVVTLQASVFTSMLAAVILERIGTPLFHGPLYSTVRALYVSPNNLLSTAMLRSRGILSHLVYIIVVLEVLIVIATQFLSTILISDFGEGTFAQLINSTDVPAWDMRPVSPSQMWWKVPPSSSWTFAELSERPEEGPDFDDTGHTYRAFLPFEDESRRTTLRQFRGPAVVMDQRVVCARPSMDNLTVEGHYRDTQYLSGRAKRELGSYPVSVQDLGMDLRFSCPIPAISEADNATTETTLCFLNNAGLYLESPLLGAEDEPRRERNPIGVTARTFLLLDLLSQKDPGPIMDMDDDKVSVEISSVNGTWAVITGDSVIRLTMCVTDPGAQAFEVDINGSSERQEPRLSWNTGSFRYNADQVRHQLGASAEAASLEDRGILSLQPVSEWSNDEIPTNITSQPFSEAFDSNVGDVKPEERLIADGAVMFTVFDEASPYRAHQAHTIVFGDTMRETGSPARAVQTVLARFHQMMYYDRLPQQSMTTASTSFSATTLLPARWTGFWAATGIVLGHLVLLVTVTTLFLGFTSCSSIGSHWQAVSQVISEDTIPILEQADRIEDKDVKKWAKGRSVDLGCHTALRRRHDGRVVLGREHPSLDRLGMDSEEPRTSSPVDTQGRVNRVDATMSDSWAIPPSMDYTLNEGNRSQENTPRGGGSE